MMLWLISINQINMFKKMEAAIDKLRKFIRVDFVAFGLILLYFILYFIIKISS